MAEITLGAFECTYIGGVQTGPSNDAAIMAGVLERADVSDDWSVLASSSLFLFFLLNNFPPHPPKATGDKQKTTIEIYSGSIVFMPVCTPST